MSEDARLIAITDLTTYLYGDFFPGHAVLRKDVDKLLAARDQQIASLQQGWQPIAAYPETNDYMLLASPAHGRVIGAHVTGDVWHLIGVGAVTDESQRPTHWMPLPNGPADV